MGFKITLPFVFLSLYSFNAVDAEPNLCFNYPGSFLHKTKQGISACCIPVSCNPGEEAVLCERNGEKARCQPCPKTSFQMNATNSSLLIHCYLKRSCNIQYGEIEDKPGNKRMDRTCTCDLQNGYYKSLSGECRRRECPIDKELQMNGFCTRCKNGYQKVAPGFGPCIPTKAIPAYPTADPLPANPTLEVPANTRPDEAILYTTIGAGQNSNESGILEQMVEISPNSSFSSSEELNYKIPIIVVIMLSVLLVTIFLVVWWCLVSNRARKSMIIVLKCFQKCKNECHSGNSLADVEMNQRTQTTSNVETSDALAREKEEIQSRTENVEWTNHLRTSGDRHLEPLLPSSMEIIDLRSEYTDNIVAGGRREQIYSCKHLSTPDEIIDLRSEHTAEADEANDLYRISVENSNPVIDPDTRPLVVINKIYQIGSNNIVNNNNQSADR